MKPLLRIVCAALTLACLPALARAQEVIQDYKIGPRDLLDIRVFEIPELNLERRVSDNGTIGLPLLGEFSVAGMTSSELRARLESMLTAKYVNRANVSVLIKEFSSKPVSIVGAVRNPGALTVSGRWSLLQAISNAGGLTEAAGRKIFVLRRGESGLSDTLEIDADDLFRGSSSQWNIPLVPGDVVNIPAKRMAKVFVLGEVKQPGSVEFDDDDRITVLGAIARVGGLTERASRKVRIKRRAADGRTTESVINFKRIVAGKDPDLVLSPDDVLIIEESFF
ncbi:MAG TPA: polysaccharide biosynthesis/export family protein [Thermoanaerobaculia bacterium]|nr:polysaccharide biosynthesis/export family protein [Thermoanaerobaculia bacterium]